MKTVICDAREDFRQGLRVILERENIEIVAEAEDGPSALRMVENLAPDTVIADMNTKGLNGFELSRHLGNAGIRTQVVILSLFEDEISVLGMFKAGVRACVMKTHASTDLIPALHQLARGRRYLSPGFIKRVVNPYLDSRGAPNRVLSTTETEILHLLALDVPKNEISRKLAMSVENIEVQRKQIMERLNAVNNGALVRYAVRHGLFRT